MVWVYSIYYVVPHQKSIKILEKGGIYIYIKWKENKWLLLSATVKAKFELVFVENAFS